MFASSWLAATSQAVPPPPPLLGSGGSENANCLWAKPTEGLILGYSDILDMFPVPVSGNDWVSDCRLACEDSALHTFVNGKHAFTPEEVRLFRDSASERYCEGIVLVEMPYNCEGDAFARRVWDPQADTEPVYNQTSFPWCYTHLSTREEYAAAGDIYRADVGITNNDELADKINSFSEGMPDFCRPKVTTISLLGCRTGDDPNTYSYADNQEDDLLETWEINHRANQTGNYSRKGEARNTGNKQARGQLITWAAWVLLPLCLLLAAGIVLLYRHFSRRSANLLLSRDRAQLDLQLLSHQVTRVKRGTVRDDDTTCSLPDSSLPGQRSVALALRGAPSSTAGFSLPPGPPSSSNAQSVVEQEQAAPRAAAEVNRQSPAEGAGGSKRKQAAPVDLVEAYRKQHAKGAGRSRGKEAVHMLEEVPLSWAEADRQFYASAAGKAYLAGRAETAFQAKQAGEQVAPLGWTGVDQPQLAESVGFELDPKPTTPALVYAIAPTPSAPETRARQDAAAAEAMADLSGNVATTATGGATGSCSLVLDDGDDRGAIRRGLQAGPSQPYHLAESTNSSETGAPAPSDAPPPSLPPGPPSSSVGQSSKSGKSSKGTGKSSRAVHGKSTAPPPTLAELDAQLHSERAAKSAAERGMPPGAPSSTAGAPSSQRGQSTVPPPSSAEIAYRQFYAERAARLTTEQGGALPMGKPPTWAELGAQHNVGGN